MSVTLDALQAVLRRWEYQPGWTFVAYQHPVNRDPWIRISATVRDSRNPSSTTDLCVRSPLPPFDVPMAFVRWLNWRLKQIAVHEVDEWGRLDGEVIFDPHADGFNDDALV